MTRLRIRNRVITEIELNQIQETITTYWDLGRTAISRILCEKWDWQQANGRYKEMACRELLLRLESKELIQLPPRKKEKVNRLKILPLPEAYTLHQVQPLTGRIDSFKHIDIELAGSREKRRLWDSLVHEYHYLGYKHIVGSCLKYLIYLDDHLACCMGWGSAAWKVGSRDQFIGWSREQRKQRLNSIANNVRFLILPWVKVQHFASKILALSAKVLVFDWQQQFKEEVVLLETFVDPAKFHGTSYRAANWIYLGTTRGLGKSGASYHRHGIIKSVFVYPLNSDFRKRLCQ